MLSLHLMSIIHPLNADFKAVVMAVGLVASDSLSEY